MNKEKQRLELRLHSRKLYCWRLNAEGERIGSVTKWKIGRGPKRRSWVPKAMFFLIWSYVRRRVKQTDDKSFPSAKKAILRALCEAAEACGCTPEFGRKGGDVCWFLNGQPLIAFQIHDDELMSLRVKKMLRKKALLRWVFMVKANGLVRYDICEVRA